MVIDHIGIVVKSIDNSLDHWEKLFGYKPMTEVVVNTRQKVKVIFLSKDNSLPIKLVEPTDETSSVYRISRKGGGLHHICFKCGDVNKKTLELKNLGLRLIAEPQPGEAFENENIAFFYSKDGVNIELIDTDRRAKLINNNK